MGAFRIVTLIRAEHAYAPGYWDKLVGLDVRMPAVVENGRVLAGFLVGVRETDVAIELTFEGLGPED